MRKFLFFVFAVLILASCANNDKAIMTLRNTPSGNVSEVGSNVKVYVENSASMDGYINGGTEFENIIREYLDEFTYMEGLESIPDSMKKQRFQLNFISSKGINDSVQYDVGRFIDKLEPYQFRGVPGRGTTDIAQAIILILNKSDVNDISVFITDGVFSVSKSDDYLIQQQQKISNTIRNFRSSKNPDFGVMIYQFSAQFNGTYYDKRDSPVNYKGKRPFFMWFFGSSSELARWHKELEQRIQSWEKENEFVMLPIGLSSVKIQFSRGDTIVPIDSKESVNVELQLHTNYDLETSGFALESKNYNIEKVRHEDYGYAIEIVGNGGLYYGDYSISYNNDVSYKSDDKCWWNLANDFIGVGVPSPGKTYGIYYQIEGVRDAFRKSGYERDAFNIDFNVRTK